MYLSNIVGLTTNNNETAYSEEVQHLAKWYSHNSLDLNTTKTKELIIAFKRQIVQGVYTCGL